MSKTSFKNAIDAKRLQVNVANKNEKGENLSYCVSSKDGKFKRVLRNGISGEKTASDNDAKSKSKKDKSKVAKTK